VTLILPEAKALFVHIPKTGGNWVKRALERAGVHCHPANRRQGISIHCPPQFCLDSYDFAFAFVRHPLSWYESWWKYQQGKWTRFESDSWHPQRCIEACANDDFNAFVAACLAQQPAYVTRLYEWYCGPAGAELDFIGRTESLADDLVDLLHRLSYKFDEEALRTTPAENVSPGVAPVWRAEVREKALEFERSAIDRFYGEHVDRGIEQRRACENNRSGNGAIHMGDFATAWKAADPIKGWLSEDEARHLFAAACRVNGDSRIVEVGTYRGKSTVLLAHTGRGVTTVDPMELGEDPVNRLQISEADVTALKRAIGPFKNVQWMRTNADSCPLPGEPIGLLYVDGSHEYPRPRVDFEHFAPALSSDAVVAFHDYKEFAGVTQTVAELEEAGILTGGSTQGSMYVARIAGSPVYQHVPQRAAQGVVAAAPEPTPEPVTIESVDVTGFHLFALCHRFGLRGRAFARSLAEQRDNPYRLHLTVFYSEPEDASLVLEGATSGGRPPVVTFIHVPEERIMQRALLFMIAQASSDCSHTVFLDCDLWFPPQYFRNFGDALSREAAGYWSCYVKDIERERADRFVESWREITADLLETASCGPRHDGWKGKVGHFQCIPTGLVAYPEDHIHAVNRADEVFARKALERSQDDRDERRIGAIAAYHFDHPSCWSGTESRL
jgi:hypothetical protein